MRGGRERAERRERVERRIGLGAPRRLEVVVDPERVDAGELEQFGDRADLVPGAAVLRHADPDARCRPAHGLPTTTTSWAVGAAAWSAADAGMGAMSVMPRSVASRAAIPSPPGR